MCSPGRASFQPCCCLLQSETSSQGWGWELTLWGSWLQPGLPAVPGSWLGGSEPLISVSQEAHQASQAVLQWKTTCGLMSVHWNRYVLTWNFLALTNQCFPVKWRVVRSLMTGSNCHFDDQNLYWPETHNFLAITKDLEQKEKKIEKANQAKNIFCFVLNNCEICRTVSGQSCYEERSCLQGSGAGHTYTSISVPLLMY